jgi:hypothetical protein
LSREFNVLYSTNDRDSSELFKLNIREENADIFDSLHGILLVLPVDGHDDSSNELGKQHPQGVIHVLQQKDNNCYTQLLDNKETKS